MRTCLALELKAFLRQAGSRLTKEEGGIPGAVFPSLPKGGPYGLNPNMVGDLQILKSRVEILIDRLNTIYPDDGFSPNMSGGSKKRSSKKK